MLHVQRHTVRRIHQPLPFRLFPSTHTHTHTHTSGLERQLLLHTAPPKSVSQSITQSSHVFHSIGRKKPTAAASLFHILAHSLTHSLTRSLTHMLHARPLAPSHALVLMRKPRQMLGNLRMAVLVGPRAQQTESDQHKVERHAQLDDQRQTLTRPVAVHGRSARRKLSNKSPHRTAWCFYT
jgi:hypothetical protein